MPTKRSAAFVAAVNALQKLITTEGIGEGEQAYRVAMETPIENLFIKTHKVKETGGRICIHRLAGVRCPSPCDSDRVVPAHDHVTLWNKDGKPYVFITQPYGLSYEQMKATVAICEKLAMRADIHADEAWHFPSRVLSIQYKRASAEE